MDNGNSHIKFEDVNIQITAGSFADMAGSFCENEILTNSIFPNIFN